MFAAGVYLNAVSFICFDLFQVYHKLQYFTPGIYTKKGKKTLSVLLLHFMLLLYLHYMIYFILLAKATPGKKPLKKVDQRIFGRYI